MEERACFMPLTVLVVLASEDSERTPFTWTFNRTLRWRPWRKSTGVSAGLSCDTREQCVSDGISFE